MRIHLLTAGTRGDVDPFIAVAVTAAERGHEVCLSVTEDFAPDALARRDIELRPLGGSYAELIAEQGVSAFRALRTFRASLRPMMVEILRTASNSILAWRPDIVVYHPKIMSAPLAAAALDIPHVEVEIVPALSPTRNFPAAGVTARDLGALNPTTFKITKFATALFSNDLRRLRSQIGLPRSGSIPAPTLTLCPVSPSLVPRPADWPETTQMTGPWLLPPEDTRLEPELEEFLSAADDVVYAGFGSMVAGDAKERTEQLVAGIRTAERRGLLVTGWGGLDDHALPPGSDVYVTKSVPHHTVLPRVCAAIHHGGAGTVHAAARAGVVSVVVPFIADQPWWGAHLHRQGLGPAPIPRERLAARPLVRALLAVPDFQPAISEISEQLHRENGADTAVTWLETLRS